MEDGRKKQRRGIKRGRKSCQSEQQLAEKLSPLELFGI
jgi:hypothetical protein